MRRSTLRRFSSKSSHRNRHGQSHHNSVHHMPHLQHKASLAPRRTGCHACQLPATFFMFSWMRGRMSKSGSQLRIKNKFIIYKSPKNEEDAMIPCRKIFKIIIGDNLLLPPCLKDKPNHLLLTLCKRVNDNGIFESYFFFQENEKEHAISGFLRQMQKYYLQTNKTMDVYSKEQISNAIKAIKEAKSGCCEINIISRSIAIKMKEKGKQIHKKVKKMKKLRKKKKEVNEQKAIKAPKHISFFKSESPEHMDANNNNDNKKKQKVQKRISLFKIKSNDHVDANDNNSNDERSRVESISELRQKYNVLLRKSQEDERTLMRMSAELQKAKRESYQHRVTISAMKKGMTVLLEEGSSNWSTSDEKENN